MSGFKQIGIGLGLLLAIPAAAGTKREVIDLGSLQIDGAARGPEIQFIDGQSLGAQAGGKLLLRQLEQLETKLLKPEPAKGHAGKGGQR